MRSSNPVFSSLTSTRGRQATTQNPYQGFPPAGYPQGQQSGYPQGYGSVDASSRPITVDDVITKTGITLAIIIAFGALNFGIAAAGYPGITMLLTFVGMIGGLITVLVSTLGRKYGSAAVTITYAVLEGLFVGGFSVVMSGFLVGGADAGLLIGQAVIGTVGVFLGMLWAYKSGTIKVTPKFTRFLMGALVGVLVLALGNLVASFFGMNVLRGDGPLAIIFSLVCIVLASLSFLQDFDEADKLVRAGAPAKMAWGVALGLAVTLVWLYTEILRLLSILRNN